MRSREIKRARKTKRKKVKESMSRRREEMRKTGMC